jgi:hypothetical protein
MRGKFQFLNDQDLAMLRISRVPSFGPVPEGKIPAVYNTKTRQIKYKDPGSLHPEIAEDGGWWTLRDGDHIIGSNVTLADGQVVNSSWRNASGSMGNSGWKADEAEAATAIIKSIQSGQIACISLGVMGGAAVTTSKSSLTDEDL